MTSESTEPLLCAPQRYRKRPVVIEAIQFEQGNEVRSGRAIAEWCGGRLATGVKPSDHMDVSYRILIPTLEGTMHASPGDWIIRGVKGEFYPCKPDIFADTYEADDAE
jgi:hypothetical protein